MICQMLLDEYNYMAIFWLAVLVAEPDCFLGMYSVATTTALCVYK